MTPEADQRPVLVVDDNEVNRQLLSMLLRALGEQVEVADSGHAAVELVNSKQYALVLMDCQMPGLDGYETTRAIRCLPLGSTVPVIAVTADAAADVAERASRAGMNGSLQKPVELEQLRATLTKWSSSQ